MENVHHFFMAVIVVLFAVGGFFLIQLVLKKGGYNRCSLGNPSIISRKRKSDTVKKQPTSYFLEEGGTKRFKRIY